MGGDGEADFEDWASTLQGSNSKAAVNPVLMSWVEYMVLLIRHDRVLGQLVQSNHTRQRGDSMLGT